MKKLFILGIIIGMAAGGFFWHRHRVQSELPRYDVVPVARGTLKLDVTASGTIQPINVVSVGTQVSGIIERVYVDYNSVVRKGDLLAEIDRFTLQQDLNEAKAQAQDAKSKRNKARLDAKRYKEMFEANYISRSEMEQAEVDAVAAQSDYDRALAQVKKAERNLGYARITSPVSGTVTSKVVEEGQTVAASFSTPELFQIAEDLTKMQIETYISEADVGMIKPGLKVDFTVDTYPAEIFHGTVSQVRLNPTEEETVVMYTVIIDIKNDDLKLLPGMTAYVEIKIDEKPNVLRLPNMAFQFRPVRADGKYDAQLRMKRADLKPDEALVFILENGKVVPRTVKKGLTNEMFTEIISGVQEGEQAVLEDLTARVRPKRRGPP